MSCCASSLRPWLVSPLSASLRGFQRLSDAHRAVVALAAGLAAVYGPANAPERGRLREGAESYAKALASDILR